MEYKDLQKVNSEMKMTDIKGKAYAEVPQRIQAFRKLFPDGTIITELVSCQNGICIFKATAMAGDVILGTGHAYEKENSSFINKTSYIENCETSAVGRALGMIGIGSETSMASYEEVANAKLNQGNTPRGNDDNVRAELINAITDLAPMKGTSVRQICNQAHISSLSDAPTPQLQAIRSSLAAS